MTGSYFLVSSNLEILEKMLLGADTIWMNTSGLGSIWTSEICGTHLHQMCDMGDTINRLWL